MTAVTPSTNKDSSWIAWAGVETGAKMFVGLSGEGVDCAEAVAATKHGATRTKGATRMREWFECVVCIPLVDGATLKTRSGPPSGARWCSRKSRIEKRFTSLAFHVVSIFRDSSLAS